MKETFKGLDADRQYEIITAAMIEFAEHGYKRASTNRIVKRIGMSKGMLYYYFDSKRALFDSCFEYCLEHIYEGPLVNHPLQWEGYIERCTNLSREKYHFFKTHPEIAKFMTYMYFSNELNEEQKGQRASLLENRKRLLNENIDYSHFREDMAPETLMKMINWTIRGYSQELEQYFEKHDIDMDHLEPYFEEYDYYLNALRKLYYKEEYQ
ncbi:TetR/AcrR family transcriptional regulator [Salinicoccus albus]|uniref:TetR/AcrR family transcriptional regulator n=1 Tax=Salinicoccus albus TaxID=418756 RepID=UPI00036F5ACD|nr:TetR/AcrR family transcriptional regulator [Salinicoccus albus]